MTTPAGDALPDVHAEGGGERLVLEEFSRFLFMREVPHPPPSAWTSPGGIEPKAGVYVRKYHRVRGLLKQRFKTWKRAEMILEGLRLQAQTGVCYASARWLSGHVWANPKTWHRLSKDLREQGLIDVERLYRSNRTQSVYITDFSRLWEWLLDAIRASARKTRVSVRRDPTANPYPVAPAAGSYATYFGGQVPP